MNIKLLSEHHLEFLSLKGGCTGSSKSTLVKMPHFWKLHVTAQMGNLFRFSGSKKLDLPPYISLVSFSNCFLPMFSSGLSDSDTSTPVIFFVSKIIWSLVSSMNGFPCYSMVFVIYFTCSRKCFG